MLSGNLNGAAKYVYCMIAVALGMVLLAFVAFLLHQSGWSAGDLAPLLAGELAMLGFLNTIGAFMVAYLHSKPSSVPPGGGG